jgi:cell wall assembly regulator SMI1
MSSSPLSRELERAKQILGQHGFALDFAPGVSRDQLARAGQVTALSFDNALGDLFLAANGSFGKTCFAIKTDEVTPCSLVSLKNSLAWWSEWLPYDAATDAQFGPAESGRDPRIRPEKFVHAKWFPFAECNGWGTTAYFDMDPGVAGKPGQVIAYQHDPDAVYFVADSVATFLSSSNTLLERHARDLLFVDGAPSIFSPRCL